MKNFLLISYMETMIWFLDGLLVVMLMYGLGLPLPLIILWMLSIFFVLRVGNTSLILRMFLVLLLVIKVCTYDLPGLALAWDGFFILKNLEILLTSLGILAGIRGSNLSTLASLLVFFFLDLLLLTGLVFGV